MKKLVIANWKMNPATEKLSAKLASQVERGFSKLPAKNVESVICPPFVFLPSVGKLLRKCSLGAQDVAAKESGPYTGEVSARELSGLGVRYVIVGHSERRSLGESDLTVRKKIELVLKHGLRPVLCVGFGTKKSSSPAEVKRIIKKQISAVTRGQKPGPKEMVIAYEPVWAISRGLGTGTAVSPEQAKEVIDFIKKQVGAAKVIYGGSIDSKNAAGFAKAGIAGGLVGGASLHPAEFLKILRAFSNY